MRLPIGIMEQVAAAAGGGLAYESHTANTGNVANLTLTKPSGISNDDLLILVGSDSSNSGWTAPTGWTAIVQDNVFGANANACFRVATGHATYEAATIDYGNATSRDKVGSYIHISGNATSSVVNVQDSIVSGANGTSYTLAELTTTVVDTMCFYVVGFDEAGGSPFSITGGTGWTEREDHSSGSGTSGAAMTWGTKEVASIGGTGTVTIDSSASNGYATFMFVIAPA